MAINVILAVCIEWLNPEWLDHHQHSFQFEFYLLYCYSFCVWCVHPNETHNSNKKDIFVLQGMGERKKEMMPHKTIVLCDIHSLYPIQNGYIRIGWTIPNGNCLHESQTVHRSRNRGCIRLLWEQRSAIQTKIVYFGWKMEKNVQKEKSADIVCLFFHIFRALSLKSYIYLFGIHFESNPFLYLLYNISDRTNLYLFIKEQPQRSEPGTKKKLRIYRAKIRRM